MDFMYGLIWGKKETMNTNVENVKQRSRPFYFLYLQTVLKVEYTIGNLSKSQNNKF